MINLGIKVPPEDLIKAFREHHPDAIGLSGLLVKSAHQMVVTGGDLKDDGVNVPLLVGGAALSEKFTKTKIGPELRGADVLRQGRHDRPAPAERDHGPGHARASAGVAYLLAKANATACAQLASPKPPAAQARSSKVRTDIPIPAAPYLDRRVRDVPNLAEVWSYINPFMLYGRHLGFKGNFEKLLAERDPKALKLFPRCRRGEGRGRAVHESESRLAILRSRARRQRHSLVRTRRTRARSTPSSSGASRAQMACASAITFWMPTKAGAITWRCSSSRRALRYASESERAKQAGEFFKAHALQALAIETAEGCAEWLHRRIREDWGFPDPPTMTMQERFTSRYRGKRYSFGYPACPNLDDQQGIWKLLTPTKSASSSPKA